MSENTDTAAVESQAPKAATIAELRAACAGADADFLVARLEAGATVAQAQTAWIAEQNARLAAAQTKADEQAKAAAEAAAKTKLPGVATLGEGGKPQADAGGDAVAQWNEAVPAKQATIKNRRKAMAAVVHEQPELHQAYLEAVNAGR